jgi:hypothetical protein
MYIIGSCEGSAGAVGSSLSIEEYLSGSESEPEEGGDGNCANSFDLVSVASVSVIGSYRYA